MGISMKTKRKAYPYLLLIAVAAVAGTGGFVVGKNLNTRSLSTTQSIRENNNKYEFIHPLLAVTRSDMDVPSPTYTGLLKKVQDYISQEKSTDGLSDASVYFTDYKKNGGSFALNVDDAYAPASMLKVVIMIGYLKEADSDDAVLSNSYVYNAQVSNLSDDVPFEAPSALVVGASYTVDDLIHKMIIDSDNGAMNLLLAHIDDAYLSQVYSDLGLRGPSADGTQYTISAKDYSLFFRILYNSTYLSRENSELALSLLSQSTFHDGLVAGVPAGIPVAHKFGEHINGTADNINSVELHDCGFVYPSDAPYLLCVMTKSSTLGESEKVISNISKIIYNGR